MNTNDLRIVVKPHNFELMDHNSLVVFASPDWNDIASFADSQYMNIVYEPKDLIFDLDPKCPDGAYVYFDVKYQEGNDNLGGHNVYNLPSYIDKVEMMECTFSYDDSVPEQQVIKDLVALGATYTKFL